MNANHAECNCVDPKAPVVCCANPDCGAPVHTCEREEAVNNDYRCPAHPDGSELSDGRWVCSEACYDRVIDCR